MEDQEQQLQEITIKAEEVRGIDINQVKSIQLNDGTIVVIENNEEQQENDLQLKEEDQQNCCDDFIDENGQSNNLRARPIMGKFSVPVMRPMVAPRIMPVPIRPIMTKPMGIQRGPMRNQMMTGMPMGFFRGRGGKQQGGFGKQQVGFGPQQGGFGKQQVGFGPQQGGFGKQQGGFGQQQFGFGPQQGGFGPQQGGFGQQQFGFGPQQRGFGPQQGGFGFGPQQSGFGPHKGGFGQQQGRFGPQQGGFGPQQGGFGPQKGGFGPQQGGFGPQQGGFGPQKGGYEPKKGGFGPQQGGFGPQKGGFEPKKGGFGPQQGGFGPQQVGFGPQQGGFEPKKGGFEPKKGGFEPQKGGFGPQQGGFGPQKGGFEPQYGQSSGNGTMQGNQIAGQNQQTENKTINPPPQDNKKDNPPVNQPGGVKTLGEMIQYPTSNQPLRSRPNTNEEEEQGQECDFQEQYAEEGDYYEYDEQACEENQLRARPMAPHMHAYGFGPVPKRVVPVMSMIPKRGPIHRVPMGSYSTFQPRVFRARPRPYAAKPIFTPLNATFQPRIFGGPRVRTVPHHLGAKGFIPVMRPGVIFRSKPRSHSYDKECSNEEYENQEFDNECQLNVEGEEYNKTCICTKCGKEF